MVDVKKIEAQEGGTRPLTVPRVTADLLAIYRSISGKGVDGWGAARAVGSLSRVDGTKDQSYIHQ